MDPHADGVEHKAGQALHGAVPLLEGRECGGRGEHGGDAVGYQFVSISLVCVDGWLIDSVAPYVPPSFLPYLMPE